MNYIYAKWKWKKQCFEIIAQKISAKNMNNDLVFFRDKIKIFLISWFETRSRFVSSTSRASRRDREFVPSNLEFRDGDEILKKISCGRARYLVAKSHEIFRDREISSCYAFKVCLRARSSEGERERGEFLIIQMLGNLFSVDFHKKLRRS